MTTTLKRAVVIAALFGAAACGSIEQPSTGQPSSQERPPAATETTRASVPASWVSVVRRGGLRPQTVSLRFADGRVPPDGYTRADVAAVLRAAGSGALRYGEAPAPTDTCCDQYVYQVSIGWHDGTSRAFTAVQGAARPAALADLLRLVEHAAH